MAMKIAFFLLLLIFTAISTEIKNIFPNESSVKLLRNMKTNKFSWEDENNLIPNKIREQIETSLQQKGETLSNGLFICLSNWYSLPSEAISFAKKLMFPISEDVDVATRDEYDQTPLMLAVTFDAEKAAAKLIERGMKIEAVDKFGLTALHFATINGNDQSCNVLLENGANVNAKTKLGTTVLMCASEYGHAEIMKLLLQAGADTTVQDNYGNTAFNRAAQNCVEIIKSHGRLNLYPNESSIKVFRDMKTNEISWEDKNNLISNEVKQKIEHSLQLKGEEMSNGLFNCFSDWYPFFEAKPFVKELMLPISQYIAVNKRGGDYNESPLMISATFDSEKAVVKLIERGARIEATDADGMSALQYAATNGSQSSCKVLLERGANVNTRGNDGQTPLMRAAMYGFVQVVELLIQSGADAQMKTEDGNTALDFATQKCAEAIRAKGPFNLFPNDSSVKLFRDRETKEFSWEDPNNLIRNEIKEQIDKRKEKL